MTDDIMKQWESGNHSKRKYVKLQMSGYKDLDKLVWKEYYCQQKDDTGASSYKLQSLDTMVFLALMDG